MGKTSIGFIGQGFIGKHMADDFENRGFPIVRYSLEKEFIANKPKLVSCSIVFIAVPTPTTEDGFDFSIVKTALSDIADGSTAIIKSTILPGTTEKLQQEFPSLFIMHAPEFLREKTAANDTAHPERNIIGIPIDNEEYRTKANAVMEVLPPAPYDLITSARTAECIKYIGNSFLYTKLVFMNMAYAFVDAAGADWATASEAVSKDSRIGPSHVNPVDEFGNRGAGGHCFIKDFEALIGYFKEVVDDPKAQAALEAYRNKNNELLLASHKDLDLLEGVYGDTIPH